MRVSTRARSGDPELELLRAGPVSNSSDESGEVAVSASIEIGQLHRALRVPTRGRA
jgi:hypothetical protein